MEPQEKALLESAVSVLMLLHDKLNKTTSDKDSEKRFLFRAGLVKILDSYRPDPMGWEAMKNILPYDDYLTGRKVDGSITEYDLIRPGLLKAQFDSEYAYHEHQMRVSADKDARGKSYSLPSADGEKECSKCGLMKPLSKFRRKGKGGGAVCHSCRGQIYRGNKKREAGELANQPRFFTGNGMETTTNQLVPAHQSSDER